MSRKSVTIRDVAREAGVSVATASRVLNGKDVVRPETRDRILGVMADLVPPNVLAELTTLMGAPYGNTFGSTETGSAPASKGLIDVGVIPERFSKVQSSLCEIRLVDENDCDVLDGEPGEALVRSPGLFSGYWRAPTCQVESPRWRSW